MGSFQSWLVGLGFAALGWLAGAPQIAAPDVADRTEPGGLVEAAGPAGSASAHALKEVTGTGNCANHKHVGQWTCNCTDSDVTVQLCEGKSVEVSFGGKVVRASTGATASNCVGATAKPGTCVAMQYNYYCCIKIGVFFDSVSCDLIGKSVVQRPTKPEDC